MNWEITKTEPSYTDLFETKFRGQWKEPRGALNLLRAAEENERDEDRMLG